MKKNKQQKRGGRIVKIIFTALLIAGILAVGYYLWHNVHYFDQPLRQTAKAGFVEKIAQPDDAHIINYAEGPDNGPSLLLIHGQTGAWQDYARVLPDLSEFYHIYLVDCYGHGGSSHDPERYSAAKMGPDFIWFTETIIGEPAVVSGHSSGGLMTAWLAANAPENVLGTVLEDPPFFSTEPDRREKTFAWIDTHQTTHQFLNQNTENDFTLYYLEHSLWLTYFGEGREGIIKSARTYRAEHLDTYISISYLPQSINHTLRFMDDYDPQFGNLFYNGRWFEGFDPSETLSKIACPSVLIHASFQYDENGVLLGAMSDEDADRAHKLIKNNTLVNIVSGHNVHFEEPAAFTEIMIDFLNQVTE